MDKREAIMVRLLEIAGGIEGVVLAARNDPNVDEGRRPAVYIYDADEQADEADPTAKRRLGQPRRVHMRPEIWLMMGGKSEDIGTALNTYRARLLKAVLTDTQLQNIVEANGDIRYEGSSTSLGLGRTMEGEAGITVTFAYFLNPAHL